MAAGGRSSVVSLDDLMVRAEFPPHGGHVNAGGVAAADGARAKKAGAAKEEVPGPSAKTFVFGGDLQRAAPRILPSPAVGCDALAPPPPARPLRGSFAEGCEAAPPLAPPLPRAPPTVEPPTAVGASKRVSFHEADGPEARATGPASAPEELPADLEQPPSAGGPQEAPSLSQSVTSARDCATRDGNGRSSGRSSLLSSSFKLGVRRVSAFSIGEAGTSSIASFVATLGEVDEENEDPDMPRYALPRSSLRVSRRTSGTSLQPPVAEEAEAEEEEQAKSHWLVDWLLIYFSKFRGQGIPTRPRPFKEYHFFSFVGAFAGIASLGGLDLAFRMHADASWTLLAPPFGAMAVLIFSESWAPLAQPYNVIVGNFLGAALGVTICEILEPVGVDTQGDLMWLAAALAVSLTIVLQERIGAVHPPGGATALVYIIVPRLRAMKAWFLMMCLVGSAWFVFMAMVTNNLAPSRTYPQRSWPCMKKREVEAEKKACLQTYLAKFAGAGVKPFPVPPLRQSGFSFMGAFVGISALGLLPRTAVLPDPVLIGCFGAMSVLLFSATKAPLAQPRNAIVGNTVGAVIGVAVFQVFELLGHGKTMEFLWLRAALAVSLTILVQEATRTVHPPGGASAMIFLSLGELHDIAFLNVLSPAVLGTVVLICVAVIANNTSAARAYPQGWW